MLYASNTPFFGLHVLISILKTEPYQMAQAVGSQQNEGEIDPGDALKAHLLNHNVPANVCTLLQQESITLQELHTFTTEDLKDWCNEHKLKTIERRRLINAVKEIPKSKASKPQFIFLGHEEKEQINQFKQMENNVKSILSTINDINEKKKVNVDSIIEEINNVCNQIQTFVEDLRKTTLVKIKSMQLNESGNLAASMESLENLLKILKHTQDSHEDYLITNFQKLNENIQNQNQNINTNEKAKEIVMCQKEYDKVVANSLKIISNNSNIYELKSQVTEIEEAIKHNLIAFESKQHNVNSVDKFKNVRFDKNAYSICQFDLKYTKLKDGSAIDCDDKHIKIGPKDDMSYSMLLPSAKHAQGYSSGQHCFRMYYKNPKGPNEWLFFGIYKYGIEPKNVSTAWQETSWGIGGGHIYCNGENKSDKSMSFLYSSNENQIDMLIDFDKGILSYSIVDDVKYRKYTFKKKFDTSIAYSVHLNLYYARSEVQVAKIDVEVFGKNKTLVQWPVEKYGN